MPMSGARRASDGSGLGLATASPAIAARTTENLMFYNVCFKWIEEIVYHEQTRSTLGDVGYALELGAVNLRGWNEAPNE